MSTNNTPIFIGGCERSGTTLLGAMLGAHPELITTPESQFLDLAFTTEASPRDTLERFDEDWRFKLWGLDPRARSSMPKDHPTLIRKLVAEYGKQRSAPPDARWVDHTPNNFQRAHNLLGLFPQAKFVHLVRDGRAVAASVMPLDWGPNTIIRAARWWVESTAHGLAAENEWGRGVVLRVRYEDLVTDPQAALLRLCEFLGIEFHPQMLSASGFQPPEYTRKQHAFVGRPPDPSRLRAWRRELSSREVEIFEAITGSFLVQLGYSLDFKDVPAPYTLGENIHQSLEELRRALFNRRRFNRRRRAALP